VTEHSPAGSGPAHHRGALLAYAVAVAVAVAGFGVERTIWVIAVVLNAVFLAYFVRHLAFAVSAARWAERDLAAANVGFETYTPSVAVLVACKNEELVVDGMVAALLGLDYPAHALTLVVVNDGSDDGTGDRLDAWAAADPRLRVLHRPPGAGGGKSGALNDALNIALAGVDAEIAVIFDADHEPDDSVLRRLARHFRDPQVGAVMGRCVVRNGAESSLASTIFIDYLSGYLVNEYGRQALFELPAYGGANCAVRVSVLRALGGWNPNTVTEDTDLTLRVLLMGHRVRYDPTAVDFEEAVLSSQRFWKQRHRWALGHQKCLRDFWRPVLRSRHLSWTEKVETMMFLWVYHIPVLCGVGLLLSALRAVGIGGDAPTGLLPLSVLLFAGPFAELAVGLLLGRVERRAAWMLVGFVPSFGLAIITITAAYLDGMRGRRYSWVKTARSGTTTAPRPALVRDVTLRDESKPFSFARRSGMAR
jgi:1,2-diacylglycerol 3-beta-glucosyltransferase